MKQIMNSCDTRCMWGFSAREQILNFTLKIGKKKKTLASNITQMLSQACR